MDRKLDALAVTLFREFARFEYCLKAAGFHNGHGDAKPDWQAFARSVTGLFENIEDEALAEAVAYFRQHPPKKQVIRDGLLDWDDAPPQTDLDSDWILTNVRRVRNNLFHGGKFNGRWFEPQRSEELLRYSLTVLEACRSAWPAISEAYENSAS